MQNKDNLFHSDTPICSRLVMTYLSNHLPIRCVITLAMHLHCTVTACVIQVRFLVPKVAQKLPKSCPKTPTKKLEHRQEFPKITADNQALNANALHLLCICIAFGMLYKRKEKIYIHTFSYIHYRSCIRCVLGRKLRFAPHTHMDCIEV